MYAWINDWVNNREAGDLRLQHGHYDVIVMIVTNDVVIIDESPHEWPQTSLSTAAHMLFYFLHDFRVLKTDKSMKDSHRLIADPLSWYCDVTQTLIVTSFGPIVIRTLTSGSLASSHRRQVGYQLLIIENYSRRFHLTTGIVISQWPSSRDAEFVIRYLR